MPAQIPRREDLTRDEALAVSRWQEQHQAIDFAALDALELPNDHAQMRRELEAPIDQRRKGRQAVTGQLPRGLSRVRCFRASRLRPP
jgi:hypothetical protein